MSRVDPTEYVDPAHRVVLLWVSVLVIQGNSNQREALIIFSMVLGSLFWSWAGRIKVVHGSDYVGKSRSHETLL